MVWQQLSDLRLLTQSKDYEPMTFPPVQKNLRKNGSVLFFRHGRSKSDNASSTACAAHVLRMSTVPTMVRHSEGWRDIVEKCYLQVGSCLTGH